MKEKNTATRQRKLDSADNEIMSILDTATALHWAYNRILYQARSIQGVNFFSIESLLDALHWKSKVLYS